LSSVLAGGDDTIIARATAAGTGALAIIRISGSGTRRWAQQLSPSLAIDKSWQAQLVTLRDRTGEALEQAIVIPYTAPRSYTGENMIELIVHGSPIIVERIIDESTHAGCRRARPGEFTMRAVANGKMDLLQAEAVHDLINAETTLKARNARLQLEGVLSASIKRVRDELVGLRARMEAAIDFAAQGIEEDEQDLRHRWDGIVSTLREMVGSARGGTLMREGVTAVLLGAPNSGKSTLFNTLLQSNRAIVNRRPGTTRDLNQAEMELGGLKITLVDTAGLTTAKDEVEQAGIDKARVAAAEADLVLLLWAADSDAGCCEENVPAEVPQLKVRSKADLGIGATKLEEWLPVSANTGQGVEELCRRIVASALDGNHDRCPTVAISRRHAECLDRAIQEMATPRFEDLELAAEQLRWAQRHLAEVIGEITPDQMYERVFAQFCLGK